MNRSQCTESGLGEISTVADIGTEINGLGVLATCLADISHSIVVHTTSIDISCTMFVYSNLENTHHTSTGQMTGYQ